MLIERSYLTLAVEQIEEINNILNNSLLSSVYLELTTAVNLAEAYLKTRDSIYWRNANVQTQKRVKKTLDNLLKQILNHVTESKKTFNQFCDEQERLKLKPSPEILKGLYQFKNKFREFENLLNEEYQEDINPRQLKLLEV